MNNKGFSPFPGNTNQLILKLKPYCKTLDITDGIVPEFVNPKYADSKRTVFKKATRLECMMQVLFETAYRHYTLCFRYYCSSSNMCAAFNNVLVKRCCIVVFRTLRVHCQMVQQLGSQHFRHSHTPLSRTISDQQLQI